MKNEMTEIWVQCTEVRRVLSETEDYKAVEPLLVGILTTVERFPERKSEFEKVFKSILDQPDKYPTLIVEFCMHTLRFEAVKNYALQKLKSHPLQLDSEARHVIEAFSDDWKLAQLFEYYRRS